MSRIRGQRERENALESHDYVCVVILYCNMVAQQALLKTKSLFNIYGPKKNYQQLRSSKNGPPGSKCTMPIKIQSNYDTEARGSHG